MNKTEYVSENMEDWEDYEPFQRELAEYLMEYEKELSKTLTKETISKYSMVIGYMIDYLGFAHEINGFEDITFSMISSKLYNDFETNTQEGMGRKTMLNIIRDFFEFIYEKHGLRNKKLMEKIAVAKVKNRKKKDDDF